MPVDPEALNRAHKFLIDRDMLTVEDAARRFEAFKVSLVCGPEVRVSATLQAAVLTSLNTAGRVQNTPVEVTLPSGNSPIPLLVPWPASSFEAALRQVAPGVRFRDHPSTQGYTLCFGEPGEHLSGLRVTFDGWSFAVGPTNRLKRLAERERCVLAGVAAGALAVSECFMSCFDVSVEATHRTVGLSLWRPDEAWDGPEAAGPDIEYLPNEFWLLGLGHLGQGYLWALTLLDFPQPENVNILLQDYDRVSKANLGTCALTHKNDLGTHKTRVCRRWLEARGFLPRVCERAFDENTKVQQGDPELALCGFDGKGPRHLLDQSGFRRVVECGLGGRFDNFDNMLVHTLPRPSVPSSTFWKPGANATADRATEWLMQNNPLYRTEGEACGVLSLQLATRSVSVPFVGAFAGTLVVAETLRMACGGEAFESIDLRLSSLKSVTAFRAAANYAVLGTRLSFVSSNRTQPLQAAAG